MITTHTTKVCLECGETLGPGREDRKFCDDACRTSFNNRTRRERQKKQLEPVDTNTNDKELTIPEYITRIQQILLKNREILEGVCDEERPGRIRIRDLIGKGFNTKFFTSEAEPTGTGNIYRFCFEYGYREDENGTVIVICRKREVA